MKMIMLAGAAAIALVGCASREADIDTPSDPIDARAEIRDSSGRTIAVATATRAVDRLRIRVEATGLAPGSYGAHVHTVGRCDPPGFESAGPHWNPTDRQHGSQNPQGPHLGDLPNLLVGANGEGSFEFTIAVGRMAGANRMMDEDGAALVIHANPDDYRTDPSGNSGARIACGVFS